MPLCKPLGQRQSLASVCDDLDSRMLQRHNPILAVSIQSTMYRLAQFIMKKHRLTIHLQQSQCSIKVPLKPIENTQEAH